MRSIPKFALGPLAERWEQNTEVRRQVLWQGKLLTWLSAESVGVPSYAASSLNYEVLKDFFEVWTQLCETKRTPSVPECKQQAESMCSPS